MTEFPNFTIFVEPEFKLSYQEDSIRDGEDYWIQINCANGKYLTVSSRDESYFKTIFLSILVSMII